MSISNQGPVMTKRKHDRRGGNAVEFALTLPIFLFMMMAVFDYGYLMMSKALLDAAIMEGTREGAITDPNVTPNINGVAETRADEIADILCGSCSFTCTNNGTPPLREITCTGTWPITPLVGLVPYPTTLTSVGRQLLEWQR